MPIQLVVSHELIDTISRVLKREGFSGAVVEELGESIIGLMKDGPERLEPALLLAGRDQLAMRDREDAGVLAACIASRVHLLVTDNLRDFATNDAELIDTRDIIFPDGRKRQLFALIHERADGVALVVTHPLDALAWLEEGRRLTPDAVRKRYDRNG